MHLVCVKEVDVGRINLGRVVLGGLLAGVVINLGETVLNLVVVAQEMEDALRARNLPAVGGGAIAGFVILAFLLGIVTVWLYSAIRPRFGAGVGTAVCAGVFVWFFAYLYSGVVWALMGMFSAKLVTITTLWGLAEIVFSAIAGAWLYHE
jgi:hypothetical protein